MQGSRDELKLWLSSVREKRFDYMAAVWKAEDLRRRCETVTAGWSTEPHGSGDMRRDGPLVALAAKEAELPGLYRAWEQRENEVGAFLDKLDSPAYRALLKLRYVDLLRWPVVQDRMEQLRLYYSERQIFNLHGQALNAARELWRREHAV